MNLFTRYMSLSALCVAGFTAPILAGPIEDSLLDKPFTSVDRCDAQFRHQTTFVAQNAGVRDISFDLCWVGITGLLSEQTETIALIFDVAANLTKSDTGQLLQLTAGAACARHRDVAISGYTPMQSTLPFTFLVELRFDASEVNGFNPGGSLFKATYKLDCSPSNRVSEQ